MMNMISLSTFLITALLLLSLYALTKLVNSHSFCRAIVFIHTGTRYLRR